MARSFIDNVLVQWTDSDLESSSDVTMEINKTQTYEVDSGDRMFGTIPSIAPGPIQLYPGQMSGIVEFVGMLIYDPSEPKATRQCTGVVDTENIKIGQGFRILADTSFTITTLATLGVKLHYGWFMLI